MRRAAGPPPARTTNRPKCWQTRAKPAFVLAHKLLRVVG